MLMGIIKKYRVLLVITLIVVIGVTAIFFLFNRFYQNDVKALTDFPAAYEKFDQTMADFSAAVFASNLAGAPAVDDLERKADAALVDLDAKASVRISSLIKNDAELMRSMPEIAALSGQELDALKAYKSASTGKNGDLDQLAKALADLRSQRQTAYARFQELAGPID